MKTSELTGAALDWAVAKCDGVYSPSVDTDTDGTKRINYGGMYPEWATDWAQGGPIIERERIDVMSSEYGWVAFIGNEITGELDPVVDAGYGDTPLEAAMRCYVASKLGDEIGIPKELL